MMDRVSRSTDEQRALAAIERHGALLVFPPAGREDPPSLWRALHPRTEMRWAWDEGADPKVVALWHLRATLARSRHAVYGKWYQGRAVFFSHALFADMLVVFEGARRPLSVEAAEILRLLEEDSPQSSKALRAAAELGGRAGERVWTRAMRELWERLAIVGTGEVDDGAFPSLEVGATRWIFEQAWEARHATAMAPAHARVEAALGRSPALLRHFRKVARALELPERDDDAR